jgi:anti-sigma-K factor RskA
MTCHQIDELAAAYALGALDPDEERATSEHLATCPEPHLEARTLIGAALAVPAALDPIVPSDALRARLMSTIAATPQDHAAAVPAPAAPFARRVAVEPEAAPRRPWWSFGALPSAVAAVGLAAAVGFGAWGVTLNQQLAERDDALRLVASADAAHAVTGSAGSGWVLETDGRAIFLADELAALPADQLYELWLIGPEGTPVAVGTLTDTDGVALVELEHTLGTATTFAVTVEPHRVDAPTSDPVLVATIEG